jgi:eukaryotic-like serine/threonine-protein kinase
MTRCPSCGKRLRDDTRACATHGVAPAGAPTPKEKDAGAPFVVPAPDLPGFRVTRRLGQGGFGAVFAAVRASDGLPCAIKVARADNVSAGESLAREAEALAAVGPPHVPAVHDAGELADGSVYVVMDLVEAPILADVMAAQDGPMPLEDLARVALALVEILEIAHGKGVVHCDLKPENVFVDERFGAKLFDFGLVRDVGARPAEATREEALAGTPEYMSPEQCEGRVDLDARSDLYALGVIFYELCAGGPPFWGNSIEVQQSHRSRRPPALGRRVPIAAPLEEAIMRCLAKDPARRPADAARLREMLRAGFDAERARLREAPTAATPAPPSAEGAKPAGGAKPGAAVRERRAVALLFFESGSAVAAVRDAAAAVGAQLAHAAGAEYALVFGHEVGDNPPRAAANAAEMLVARGLATRALVDLAQVSITARPDGSRRYASPLFARADQYPGQDDPLGVLLSPAAAEVLPHALAEPVPRRPGYLRLERATQASERTTVRADVAPLVGRDDLVRELLTSMRAATGGPTPTIVTLVGEAGYGKTHLAQTLVQHLEVMPGIQTIFLRAKEALGGGAGQTAREILARALALPEDAPADLGRAVLETALGAEMARECWAGVVVAMGWAPPEHPAIRAQAAAPGALRSGAARAAGEALRLLARVRPLAVVVEDAHFADEAALDALEFAALEEAACPIWIGVVARPSFGSGRQAWAARAAERLDVTLPALSPEAAAELARRLLAPVEHVPGSALARLAERTQGIPLLLVELVRGLKRDGLVRKSEKTQAWILATDELDKLPDLPLVQWLASRETESLPPELLAHARLASVMGVECAPEELEGVLHELERVGAAPETQLDASIGLRRLAETGLLVRHRRGRLGFRHALLRDSVYQGVAPAQREVIHRAAYEYFKRQEGLAETARLPQMAYHAARSGLKEEAGRLYLELAKRTLARHAYLDAELQFRHALENLPEADDDAQIAAARGRALMRFRLGRHEDASNDFALALERARKVGARHAEIDLLLDQAIVLDWLNLWAQSASVTGEAETLARGETLPPSVVARLTMGLGRTRYRAGELEPARALLTRAVGQAEPLGDDGYEALSQSLVMLCFLLTGLGQLDEALGVSARIATLADTHHDALLNAGNRQNRGLLYLMLGRADDLVADFRVAIQITREHGFPVFEALATKDLGEILLYLGRPEETEPLAYRAAELYALIQGERSPRVAFAEVMLARSQAYRGDVEGARATVERITKRQAEIQSSGDRDSALPPDGQAQLDGVSLWLRGASDEDFDALVARARAFQLQAPDVIEILELKALSALRTGRRADGLRLLEEACADAEKNAAIVLPRLRRQIDRLAAPASAAR